MVAFCLSFLSGLLCTCITMAIELFHIVYTKQVNGIVFWKAIETTESHLEPLLLADMV